MYNDDGRNGVREMMILGRGITYRDGDNLPIKEKG